MEVVRLCELRLRPVLIQGFGRCPPNTTQIVGWIVGEALHGRSAILTDPVPLGLHLDLLSGIITPWMEKPKQAQSFVSCGETVA